MRDIEKQARQMRRHTVVFVGQDAEVAALAMMGRTTKSIAKELGLSDSQVQYRIAKAQKTQGTRYRSDYRNGAGVVAIRVQNTCLRFALRQVSRNVSPKFRGLAATGALNP